MEEKRSMISELIELAKVDGQVSEQEVGFIKQIGNMMGMQDADILALFKEPAPFDPPDPHFDRIVHFQQMVLLMNVDQEVDNSEISHLRYMGMKLGLNPNAVNEVLKRMYEYPNNMIPADELIKIYAKHMN
ncbi:MAG: TerB family tellurite resistance protein [Crocinitomicaceae bacterium]